MSNEARREGCCVVIECSGPDEADALVERWTSDLAHIWADRWWEDTYPKEALAIRAELRRKILALGRPAYASEREAEMATDEELGVSVAVARVAGITGHEEAPDDADQGEGERKPGTERECG